MYFFLSLQLLCNFSAVSHGYKLKSLQNTAVYKTRRSASSFNIVPCIVLHCFALFCIVLHCFTLFYIVSTVPCIVLHCFTLSLALFLIALFYIAMFYIVPYIVLQSNALPASLMLSPAEFVCTVHIHLCTLCKT